MEYKNSYVLPYFGKPTCLQESKLSRTRGNSRSSMKMLKKMLVLLKDEVSDWLHIWMVTSLLNGKGNKAIKKEFCTH